MPRSTENLLKHKQYCNQSLHPIPRTNSWIKLEDSPILTYAILETPGQDRRIHQDPSLLAQEWFSPAITRAAINDFPALMGLVFLFKHVKATEVYAKLENLSCWIQLRSLSLKYFAVPKHCQ